MKGEHTRICLVGWGEIAKRVYALLRERNADAAIVAVVVRDPSVRPATFPRDCHLITDPSELAATGCNLVVEVASRSAVSVWAEAALRAGIDFVVGSPSALVDPQLTDRLYALARKGMGRLILPAGALGGIGALASASRLSLKQVRHEIVKPPLAWRGTEAEARFDLDTLTAPTVLFSGPARVAAGRFPANANSVVVTALAGIGLDRTEVCLVADPDAAGNLHRLEALGAFGRWAMTLENRALEKNPRSSAMTALSLVRLIENRHAGLVI